MDTRTRLARIIDAEMYAQPPGPLSDQDWELGLPLVASGEDGNRYKLGRIQRSLSTADAVLKALDEGGNFANWHASSRKVLSAVNNWRTAVPDDVYEAADELQQAMPTDDFRKLFENT